MEKTIKLDRTSTNFIIQLYEYLKKVDDWPSEYSFLKYHQNVARVFINDVNIESRGLLIFHTMGVGKTLLAVSIAMDQMETSNRQVIVLLAKSLQNNFKQGIIKYMRLRGKVDEKYALSKLSDEEIIEWIKSNYSFVSMNASNMLDQLAKVTEGSIGKEYQEFAKHLSKSAERGKTNKKRSLDKKIETITTEGNLDNKLLIVDEAQNLFRAITNGSKNALELYKMVMSAKNLKILFLTGTPISNDPFELVPCFNMLAGYSVLPDLWKEFYKYFVDGKRIKNKNKFQNRLLGLVSHVTHQTVPGKGSNTKSAEKAQKASNVNFPDKLPTVVEYVPMDPRQYVLYQLAREKEHEEGKYTGFKQPSLQSLQKPRSDAAMSYRQKSRQISNFAPPDRYQDMKFSDIPIEKLTSADLNSPKHHKMLKNIENSPGIGFVYSQFVGAGGLGSFMRLLEENGWELYPGQKKASVVSAIKKEQKECTPLDKDQEQVAISPIAKSVKNAPKAENPYSEVAQQQTADQQSEHYKPLEIQKMLSLEPKSDTLTADQTKEESFTGVSDEVVDTARPPESLSEQVGENQPDLATKIGGIFPPIYPERQSSSNITGGNISGPIVNPKPLMRLDYLNNIKEHSGSTGWWKGTKNINLANMQYQVSDMTSEDIAKVQDLYRTIFRKNISEDDLQSFIEKGNAKVLFDKDGNVKGAMLCSQKDGSTIIKSMITDNYHAADTLFGTISGKVVVMDDGKTCREFYSDMSRRYNGGDRNTHSASSGKYSGGSTKLNGKNIYLISPEYIEKLEEFIDRCKSFVSHFDKPLLKKFVNNKEKFGYLIKDENISGVILITVSDDDLLVNYVNASDKSSLISLISKAFSHVKCKMHITVNKYQKEFIQALKDNFPCREVKSSGEYLLFQCDCLNAALEYHGGFSMGQSELKSLSLDKMNSIYGLEKSQYISHLPDNLKGYHQYKEKYYSWPYLSYAIMQKGKKYPLAYVVLKFFGDRSVYIKKFIISDRLLYPDCESVNPEGIKIGQILINIAKDIFSENNLNTMIAKIKAEKSCIKEFFDSAGFHLAHFKEGRWIYKWPGIADGSAPVSNNKRDISDLDEFIDAPDAEKQTVGGGSGGKAQKRKKYFAFITGAVDTETRQHIQNTFNSPENKHGGIIDLLLLSSTGAEGLDLKNVRHEHEMEPYWNMARMNQIEARGIRNDAHIDLPKDERNVQVYLYISVKPKQETGNVNYTKVVNDIINSNLNTLEVDPAAKFPTPQEQKIAKDKPSDTESVVTRQSSIYSPVTKLYTTDMELYINSVRGQILIQDFENALKEISIECLLNGEDYCRVCAPNDSKLFYKDIDRDMQAVDPCIQAREKKIKAEKIKYNSVDYYYTPDPDSIYDYKVYEFSSDLQKYVPLAESDPLLPDIVEEIEKKKSK